MALITLHNVLGRALRHDHTAAITTLRTHINDPVGGFDHFEIMFDHNDGVALLDKLMEDFQKLRHIVEMEACRWLVEDIKRPAGRAAGAFF